VGKARDQAGNIWETDAQGNPVRLLTPAPSNPMNNPLVDPRLAPQVAKAQNEAVASASDPAKAQADAIAAAAQARIAEAQAAVANAKNATDLQIAQANLAKTQAELAQLQAGKGSALDALQAQMDRVGELYRQRLQGGLPNAVNSVIPDAMQPNVSAFNSAAQGLINPFQAAFRIPGVGSQSDLEARQFMEANTPSANDSDAVIEEKLRNIQTRIDAERAKQGGAKPRAQPPQPDHMAPATGQTRDQIDPALRATGQRVGAMIAQGVPDAQIIDVLQKTGINPADTSIQQALQFRKTDDFKRWQRANPGQPYPIGPSFYTKQVPMSGARSLFNKVSQNDAVGAAESGIVAAGNSLTGDRGASLIGKLSGDPEMAKTGMEMLRTNHPLASLGGDIAGQALFEAGLGRIPGANALMATRWGRRGADALYGGYYGSGDDSGGDPLAGALGGAATNTLGGMFGRGAQKATGRTLAGVKNQSLQYLDNLGVPLTIGQIGHGSDNVLGKAVGGIEDRAAGLPVFDAIINSARRRGEHGFNSAAFREAGGSGITGAPGVQELSGNLRNAYSFLDPVSLPLDAQFAGSQAGVRATLPNLPKYGQEIGTSLNVIDNAASNAALTGRDWQQALRSVKSDKASLRGKEFSQGAIDTLGDMENNLLGLAQRQAPSDLQSNLASANGLNKQFNTITAALDNGPTQARGELFSANRLNTASLANARNFGGRTAAVSGNRPFYDLTTAGMDVMPNQVPDSGTAGRALLYSTLFGGGLGGGVGMALNPDNRAEGGIEGGKLGLSIPFAVAALYSKPGQKILQKALLGDRPDRIVKIGDYLINRARMAGMFGSGAARDYFYQPELPQ
jgi:hypothetical protein